LLLPDGAAVCPTRAAAIRRPVGQEYHYRDAIQHPEHDQDVEHSAEVMEDQRDRQGNQK
jgi:hypothetical protein